MIDEKLFYFGRSQVTVTLLNTTFERNEIKIQIKLNFNIVQSPKIFEYLV
jgi:hypothetical protein